MSEEEISECRTAARRLGRSLATRRPVPAELEIRKSCAFRKVEIWFLAHVFSTRRQEGEDISGS